MALAFLNVFCFFTNNNGCYINVWNTLKPWIEVNHLIFFPFAVGWVKLPCCSKLLSKGGSNTICYTSTPLNYTSRRKKISRAYTRAPYSFIILKDLHISFLKANIWPVAPVLFCILSLRSWTHWLFPKPPHISYIVHSILWTPFWNRASLYPM